MSILLVPAAMFLLFAGVLVVFALLLAGHRRSVGPAPSSEDDHFARMQQHNAMQDQLHDSAHSQAHLAAMQAHEAAVQVSHSPVPAPTFDSTPSPCPPASDCPPPPSSNDCGCN